MAVVSMDLERRIAALDAAHVVDEDSEFIEDLRALNRAGLGLGDDDAAQLRQLEEKWL